MTPQRTVTYTLVMAVAGFALFFAGDPEAVWFGGVLIVVAAVLGVLLWRMRNQGR